MMKIVDKIIGYFTGAGETKISLDLTRPSSKVYKRVGLCYCLCGNISESFARQANGGYICMKCYQEKMRKA